MSKDSHRLEVVRYPRSASEPVAQVQQRYSPARAAMSVLDSNVRLRQHSCIRGKAETTGSRRAEAETQGFETYGSLAFTVSTTPQQITDNGLDAGRSQHASCPVYAGWSWNLMSLRLTISNAGRSTIGSAVGWFTANCQLQRDSQGRRNKKTGSSG